MKVLKCGTVDIMLADGEKSDCAVVTHIRRAQINAALSDTSL